MNRTKSILVAVVSIALAFSFIGCAAPQTVSLSKGLPERFFTDSNIDLDESKNVSYAFESKLANPFPYYNKAFVDLNPSYESALKYYMKSKYSVVSNDNTNYHVDVILENCTYEGIYAGQETIYGSAGGSATIHNAKVTTEMTVKVRVNVGGKLSEREIMSMGEFTGNITDAGTVSRSFDLAIRGSISRIDRFLNSIIGNATPEP
jgi:hypothetical protein